VVESPCLDDGAGRTYTQASSTVLFKPTVRSLCPCRSGNAFCAAWGRPYAPATADGRSARAAQQGGCQRGSSPAAL
jgi:hypothetical protein